MGRTLLLSVYFALHWWYPIGIAHHFIFLVLLIGKPEFNIQIVLEEQLRAITAMLQVLRN